MRLTQNYLTYRVLGCTYQIPDSSPRSTGGVHLHQARKLDDGRVFTRIVQSNGQFTDYTPGRPATPDELKMIEEAE